MLSFLNDCGCVGCGCVVLTSNHLSCVVFCRETYREEVVDLKAVSPLPLVSRVPLISM